MPTATLTDNPTSQVEPIASPFVVAIDRREQLPWTFDGLTSGAADDYRPIDVRSEPATLQAGDYSILDMEVIAIERKSLADLYQTLTYGRDRFICELDRLADLDFAAVIVEASWDEIANRPPFRTRVKPRSIVGSVLAFQQRYPVAWLTAGNRQFAAALGYRLLERYWRDVNDSKRNTTGRPAPAYQGGL